MVVVVIITLLSSLFAIATIVGSAPPRLRFKPGLGALMLIGTVVGISMILCAAPCIPASLLAIRTRAIALVFRPLDADSLAMPTTKLVVLHLRALLVSLKLTAGSREIIDWVWEIDK